MSVSALTTAMAVAAAAVPTDEAPASVAPFSSETLELEHDRVEIGPAPGSEVPLPLVLAQIAASSQSEGPSGPTVPAQSTDTPQSIDPALSQPGSQPRVPTGGQKDIVVTGRRPTPEDPLVEINAQSFKVAQSVDKSVVAPVAFAYEEVMPRLVRNGLSNFLHNLGEPVVFLNYLLQLKPGKAAETLGRFAINTALGAGGLVDVAKRKPFNLPYRHNGFANTLGYYGVKPGPYFYLPVVGPTTLRDFIGDRLDLLVLPAIIGNTFRDPKIVVPVFVLKELGRRIEIEDELSAIRATQDPYVAMRIHYLQKRQAEIDALHGRGASTIKPSATHPSSSSTAPEQSFPTPDRDDSGRPGIGGYKRLIGGLMDEPIFGLRSGPGQWFAAPGLAYTF